MLSRKHILIVVICLLAVLIYLITRQICVGHTSTNSTIRNICACYYLTDVDIGKVLGKKYVIVILEPEEVENYTALRQLVNETLVLAYVNLGYAEKWRDYWRYVVSKGIVHGETEYEDEYYVEYWSDVWINTILNYTEQFLKLGFEGVFFDNIDACGTIEDMSWAPEDPCQTMMDTICKISHYLKSKYPHIKIFVNIGGAYWLLRNKTLLDCIDGVLREELWYTVQDDHIVKQDEEETRDMLEVLKYAREQGKIIIIADPIQDSKQARTFVNLCLKYGFVPIPQPVEKFDYSEPPPLELCETITS